MDHSGEIVSIAKNRSFYLSLKTGRPPTASYNIITPCGYQVARAGVVGAGRPDAGAFDGPSCAPGVDAQVTRARGLRWSAAGAVPSALLCNQAQYARPPPEKYFLGVCTCVYVCVVCRYDP